MVACRVAPTLASPRRLIRLAIRIAALLALSVGLYPAPARAFLDPPYITPANPSVGTPISVNVYGGECDLLDYGIVWPPPVTQEGSKITILFTGSHHTDPEWCIFGVGTATYPVGTYPAGSYVLHVERRYASVTGVWIHEILGIIPFTVTGPIPAQTEAAPALGVVGVCVLLMGLTVVANRQLRSRLLESR